MINYLVYYLLVYPLSLLPFWVLYRISDGVYFLMFYVFGYRKKVVMTNLKNSFPEKSEKELKLIMKKFYHHFCDIIVESVKNFSVPIENLQKRMVITNAEIMRKYYEQGRKLVVITGHYNNWEWAGTTLATNSKHRTFAIYLPLRNLFWDKMMLSTRSKGGTTFIAPKEVPEAFEKHKNEPITCAFVGDQSPSKSARSYWTTFLNQDTAVSFGSEKYAYDYNCVVLYGIIRKVKRGYYEGELIVLTENPRELKNGVITEMHTRLNEDIINKEPQYWLWTHKRWKHKRNNAR